jgi:hypothetical protein
MVVGKLDVLGIARHTGTILENINFAIKTSTIRDFLDNSVVPYETAAPGTELKTADIATNARAYTLLISCTATEREETAKRRLCRILVMPGLDPGIHHLGKNLAKRMDSRA